MFKSFFVCTWICMFALAVAVAVVAVAEGAACLEMHCNPEGNNGEMSVCAQNEYKKAARYMDAAYDKLLLLAEDEDKSDGNTITQADPYGSGYEDSLRESQKAWIIFRDKECLLRTIDAVGGSLRRITYPECQRQLTTERTKELERYIACMTHLQDGCN